MSLEHVPLAARAAYALSAPTYDAENAVTILEDRAVRSITPPLQGARLLDAACGTGRRLPHPGTRGPHTVVGIDLVYDMIARARDRGAETAARYTRRAQRTRQGAAVLSVADLRALPCRDESFDIVWCRLVLGHVRDIAPAYQELARVARRGAHVIISDFHPAAAHAGHVRTLHDEALQRLVVEHHIHEPEVHEHAARAAGFTLGSRIDCAVGPAVRRFYNDRGRLAAYEQQRGLPLVLVLGFRA